MYPLGRRDATSSPLVGYEYDDNAIPACIVKHPEFSGLQRTRSVDYLDGGHKRFLRMI